MNVRWISERLGQSEETIKIWIKQGAIARSLDGTPEQFIMEEPQVSDTVTNGIDVASESLSGAEELAKLRVENHQLRLRIQALKMIIRDILL